MIRRRNNPLVLAFTTTLSYCLLIFNCFNVVNLVQGDASYSHSIPYGEEECLLIRVPTDQPHIVSGSFEHLDLRVSSAPIRVALYNSKEEKVYSSNYGDTEGSFSAKGMGKHWLCLENGLTYEQREEKTDPRKRVMRTIGFALRVKKSATSKASEVLGDAGSNDVEGTTQLLLDLTEDLNENFQVLTDHMSYMKAREVMHRELHEQTFTKVVRWNILEICTVVVVTFGQVLNVWWILSKRNTRSYY